MLPLLRRRVGKCWEPFVGPPRLPPRGPRPSVWSPFRLDVFPASSTRRPVQLHHSKALPSAAPEIADQVAAIDLWLERAGAAAVPENSAQAAWDAPLIDKAINSLLSEAIDEKSRARLLAASSEFSGAWLDALPAPSLGLMLSGNKIRIAIGL